MNNWHSVKWSLVGYLARQISWPWTEDNTVGHHSYLMLEWRTHRWFLSNDRHLEQRTALLDTTICYLMWVIMNDTWLITTGFVTKLTRRGPLVEQELLTPGFQWGTCYLIFSFMCMFCRSFCPFGLCVVCSSSIYRFWFPFGNFKLFWSHDTHLEEDSTVGHHYLLLNVSMNEWYMGGS